MKKITFKNGQAPYVSDTNLNQMQNNIEEDINFTRNFMVTNLSSDYTIQATKAREVMPLNKVEASNGSKLTLSSGSIKIGSGIKHVRVSANAYYYTGTNSGLKTASILRNTTEIANVNVSASGNTSGGYQHVPVPTKIISVSEGDLIKLAIQGAEGDLIKSYPQGTFLCVEVVD